MFDDVIAQDGTLSSKVLDELYYEALDLSSLVVEYLQKNQKKTLQHLSANLMAEYTLECNRITTGIMQAMSWCLMQKGVRSGEISVEQAAKKASRVSDQTLFDMDMGGDHEKLPKEFLDYSKRARDLFSRVVRLDRLLYEFEQKEENPVQGMMNKIEDI